MRLKVCVLDNETMCALYWLSSLWPSISVCCVCVVCVCCNAFKVRPKFVGYNVDSHLQAENVVVTLEWILYCAFLSLSLSLIRSLVCVSLLVRCVIYAAWCVSR